MKLSHLLLTAVVAAPLTGCAFVSTRHVPGISTSRGAVRSSSSSPECHPSQYWDGERCVHKGKGKGARKHDD